MSDIVQAALIAAGAALVPALHQWWAAVNKNAYDRARAEVYREKSLETIEAKNREIQTLHREREEQDQEIAFLRSVIEKMGGLPSGGSSA